MEWNDASLGNVYYKLSLQIFLVNLKIYIHYAVFVAIYGKLPSTNIVILAYKLFFLLECVD